MIIEKFYRLNKDTYHCSRPFKKQKLDIISKSISRFNHLLILNNNNNNNNKDNRVLYNKLYDQRAHYGSFPTAMRCGVCVRSIRIMYIISR